MIAPSLASILVVEDSMDISALLAAALEEEACTVHIARTGAQALDFTARLHPDLITLDIGLPDISGRDVIARLRANPASSAIPIIAVSGLAATLDPATAAEVTQVFGKPFYLSEVVDAVLHTLGLEPRSPD